MSPSSKKKKSVLDLFEKAIEIANSPETKKIAKEALKFARDSGLGEKALEAVNKHLSKKTKKYHNLDKLRQQLYRIAKDDVTTKKEDKSLGDALLHFTRHSGLGKKALAHANKKIKKHTRANPFLDTIHNIASMEAENYLSDNTPTRQKFGDISKQELFNQMIGLSPPPLVQTKSSPVGRFQYNS
jgi:hypothetical protein